MTSAETTPRDPHWFPVTSHQTTKRLRAQLATETARRKEAEKVLNWYCDEDSILDEMGPSMDLAVDDVEAICRRARDYFDKHKETPDGRT